jgi:hypothetical protein
MVLRTYAWVYCSVRVRAELRISDYESTALTAELQAPQSLTSDVAFDVAENVATTSTCVFVRISLPHHDRTAVCLDAESGAATVRRNRSAREASTEH